MLKNLYIGCKIVEAEPMDWYVYTSIDPRAGNDLPGYKITYPDGYVSWSPIDTFDTCYRSITKDEIKLVGEKNV